MRRTVGAFRSIHVAFQHAHEFAQFAVRVGRGRRLLDAMLHMRMDELLGECLDGPPGRHQLHEHLGTVIILAQHPFHGLELAGDFPKARGQGLGFFRGMAFAGGPYNNYFLQSTCRAAELLRQGRGRNALLSCVSGIVTKQAFGLWSREEPADGFTSLDLSDQVARETEARDVLEEFTGSARVAGYTVLHGRGQLPKGIALVDTSEGKRALITTEDQALIASMQETEWVGRPVRVAANTLTAIG